MTTMPNTGGVKFLISSAFVKAAPGTVNDISNPDIVDQQDYSEVNDILLALEKLFSPGTATAEFLNNLSGTIYITKNVWSAMAADPGNAAFLTSGALAQLQGRTPPEIAPGAIVGDTFIDEVPYLENVTTTDEDGNPVNTLVKHTFPAVGYSSAGLTGYVDLGLSGAFDADAAAFDFPDPNNATHGATTLRTLFHELAHAVTKDVAKTSWQFTTGTGTIVNTTAEALAMDAENLAYRRLTGVTDKNIRVSHGGVNPNGGTFNDPTAAFEGSGFVRYVGTGRIEADQQGGKIAKTYKADNYTVNISGLATTFFNYITIDAIGPIFNSNGSASGLLTKAFSGIAHDRSLESNILTNVTAKLADLKRIGSAISGASLPSSVATLTGFHIAEIQAATGLSNEVSSTDEWITGPQVAISTGAGYEDANQLYLAPQNSSTSSLLIGASGTRLNNVDYRDRTDYIVGSTADDILMAGTGRDASGTRVNILNGGGGDDTLVGNTSDDDLRGENGADILFQSRGEDVIDGGNGEDAFVLGKGMGRMTVDLSAKAANATFTLTVGSSVSKVSNVEIFVGNDSFTKFIGDGHSTFVAGSGGADFTLKAGDVAIGDPTSAVGNIYRISSADQGKVRILNFKQNDAIYVDGKRLTEYEVRSMVSESKLNPDNPNSPDIIRNAAGIQTTISGSLGGSLNSLSYVPPSPGVSYFGEYIYGSGTALTLVNLTPSSDKPESVVAMNFSSLLEDGSILSGLELVLTGYQDGYGGIRIRSDMLSLVLQGGGLEDFGTYHWSGHLYQDLRGQYVDALGTHPYSDTLYSPYSEAWQEIAQSFAPSSAELLADGMDVTNILSIVGAGGGSDLSVQATPPTGDIVATGTSNPEDYNIGGDFAVTREGDAGANTLVAGGGYNKLIGHGGGDTFVYSAGDGVVAIDEQDDSAAPNNIVQLGVGLSAETVNVFGDIDGNIVLDFGNDDILVLLGALKAPNADGERFGVQQLAFTDGTVWDYAALLAHVSTPSSENRTLVGDWQANLLDAAGVANELIGNGGGDTFRFEVGYGALLIDERDSNVNPANVLEFGSGINLGSITAHSTESGDLVLDLGGGDVITIKDALEGVDAQGVARGVQSFAFADGSTFSYADMLELALVADSTKRALVGDGGANTFAGAGLVERIVGNGGGDTIFYASGDGYLTIDERDGAATPENKLIFGPDVEPADIFVTADEDGNIMLRIGQADTIVLANALNSHDAATYGVQQLIFSDGTIWDYSDLLERVLAPSIDNRALFGDRNANVFDGGGIATTITGGGGGDSFRYDQGDGALTIVERDDATTPANVLELGTGLLFANLSVSGTITGDLVLSFGGDDRIILTRALTSDDGMSFGVQSVHFASGTMLDYADLLAMAGTASVDNVAIYGDRDANVLDTAGVGTHAVGGGGGDVFVYARGYGAVTIAEHDVDAAPGNSIHFGTGIAASDIAVTGDADGSITLSLGGGDTITLAGALHSLDGVTYGVQSLRFADGSSIGYADLLAALGDAALGAAALYGDTGADTLDPLGLAATLIGNGGGDTFNYNVGYGAVVIDERDTTTFKNNLLRLGAGLSANVMTVTGTATRDLVLDFGGGDTITIKGALNYIDQAGVRHGIQGMTFADGTFLGYFDLLAMAQNPSATNTVLYGDTAADILASAGLAHTLVGNGGGDTFLFNVGDGTVTIDEQDALGAFNCLVLGAGLQAGALALSGTDTGDLVLDFGSGDIITIKNALLGTDNQNVTHGVQSVRFANGVELSASELVRLATRPSLGSSTVYGDSAANLFDTGGLVSRIVGNGGGDTIYFNRGYGALEIVERDTSNQSANRLVFGEDILPSEVSISVGSGGAIVLALGTGDNITIVNALNGDGTTTYGVQSIEFANGISWDLPTLQGWLSGTRPIDISDLDFTLDFRGLPASQIAELVVDFLPADVTVTMSSDGRQLRLQTAGGRAVMLDNILIANPHSNQTIRFANDTVWHLSDIVAQVTNWEDVGSVLFGSAAAETFTGNGWFNVIAPGGGGDTIAFGRGDGELHITERDSMADPANRIVLSAGIGIADLVVRSDVTNDDTLVLDFRNGDVIYLVQGRHITNDLAFGIQTLRFADGQELSYADLTKLAVTGSADNTGVLIGDSFANVIDTGGWTEFVRGYGGGDTFVYNLGYGSLYVEEIDSPGANNVLRFGAGVFSSDVVVEALDSSLRLILPGIDEVILLGALDDSSDFVRGVQRVEFHDGTVWSYEELLLKAGVTGEASIVGDAGDNQLVGTTGNDIIDGKDGNDTIKGQQGSDILIGGFGNDILSGGSGDDLYRYNLGDGDDVIDDNLNALAGEYGMDTLRFGSGITPDDVIVAVTTDGHNYVLSFQGADGSIALVGTASGSNSSIESLEFGNGTVWDRAELQRRSNLGSTIMGSSGDDSISLPSDYQRVDAGTGNDYLTVSGNGGGTIVFRSGSGHDTLDNPGDGYQRDDRLELEGLNSADVILGRNGDQLIVAASATGDTFNVLYQFWQGSQDYGLSSIKFADGTIWDRARIEQEAWILGDENGTDLYGSDQAETIVGNGGDDYLEGRSGSDVYRYASGDGADRIYEDGNITDVDTLLLTDLNADDISLRQDGLHLWMLDLATGQEVQIDNQFYTDEQYSLEQIVFADGTVWNREQIRQAAWFRGTTGIDDIYGSSLDDTIVAGLGDDALYGGSGGDTYVYASGDGADFISDETSVADEIDTLKLTNLNASGVTLRRQEGQVWIRDTVKAKEILLNNQFYSDASYGIEQLIFGDGTVWDREQIRLAAWFRGTTGVDDINGSSLDDTFVGGLGNDTLRGGSGGDTYVYASGDGADFISDETSVAGEIDTLKLTNLNASGVTLRRQDGQVWIRDTVKAKEILLDNQFYSDASYGIEQLIFGDGTIWNREQIRQAAWFRGTTGIDDIYASELDDTLVGGLGNDTLRGGSGGDTYVYASGDGTDIVSDETAMAGEVDTLHLTNLNTANVTLRRVGDQVYVRDNTKAKDIVLENQFYGDLYGIERIMFADGTVWNREQIRQEAWFRGDSAANTLSGTSLDDTFLGGAGNDTIDGGDGMDTSVYAGLKSTYTLTTIDGSIKVKDTQTAQDGNDGTDTVTGIETLRFKNGETTSIAAPIILDLDGDGVELRSISTSGARFDFDGDGVRDRTSWIGSGDALLFLDRNGDGSISGANELSFTSDKPRAKSDLDGLSAFDTNGDGALSDVDDLYSSLRLWQDANGDGHAAPEEILTLAGAGVASIVLQGTPTTAEWSWDDAIVVNTGGFTRSNGGTGAFADVAFTYESSSAAQKAQLSASQLVQAASSFRRNRGSFDGHVRHREMPMKLDYLYTDAMRH